MIFWKHMCPHSKVRPPFLDVLAIPSHVARHAQDFAGPTHAVHVVHAPLSDSMAPAHFAEEVGARAGRAVQS